MIQVLIIKQVPVRWFASFINVNLLTLTASSMKSQWLLLIPFLLGPDVLANNPFRITVIGDGYASGVGGPMIEGTKRCFQSHDSYALKLNQTYPDGVVNRGCLGYSASNQPMEPHGLDSVPDPKYQFRKTAAERITDMSDNIDHSYTPRLWSSEHNHTYRRSGRHFVQRYYLLLSSQELSARIVSL